MKCSRGLEQIAHASVLAKICFFRGQDIVCGVVRPKLLALQLNLARGTTKLAVTKNNYC